MFNRIWFSKHQKLLLLFANSFIGRYILRISGKRSSVGRNKIIQILPNSITWKEGKYFRTEFRTHDKFGKRLFYAFKPLWKLFHLWDMVWYPKFNLGFDSLTAYPDADTETTTVDGRVYRSVASEIFGTIRAGAGTNAEDSGTNQEHALLRASSTTDQYSILLRAIYLFDTSALTSSATISATIFSVYGTNKNTANGSTTFDLVSSSPTANTSLANGDYAQLGTTVYADIASAAYSTSAYNDLTLNADGISTVSKTGVSKFGARLGWDTDNSFGGSWSSAADTGFNGYFADQAGTTNDPKLVVTYTLPGGSFFYFM